MPVVALLIGGGVKWSVPVEPGREFIFECITRGALIAALFLFVHALKRKDSRTPATPSDKGTDNRGGGGTGTGSELNGRETGKPDSPRC
jgi:hypothetical protein